jgi:cytochrome c oxidase subunit 3
MADEAREPYVDTAQQREAAILGMYIVLATEIMLFGGLFAAIAVARVLHPAEMVEASKRTHVFIGAANTAILLTSSLLVARAVAAARAGNARRAAGGLVGAAGLGLGFLALKAVEYGRERAEGLLPGLSEPERFARPAERLFMDLYLVATGLHAVHVTIGIAVLFVLALRLRLGRLALPRRAVVVETCGLYWHLVDIVWAFLFPALYLIR